MPNQPNAGPTRSWSTLVSGSDGTSGRPIKTDTSGRTDLAPVGYGGAIISITRAANQTPYTANDVVGGAVDLGIVGPSAGRVLVQSIILEPRIAAVPAGMANMRLALYTVTPPSAIADNGAWTLADADLASFVGLIDLGKPTAQGPTLYVHKVNIGLEVLLAGTNLFAYLITDVGYTPAANSEVYALLMATAAV